MRAGLAIALLCISAQAFSEVVDTSSGPVQGTTHDQVKSFLGIPFAAPPVGALRWRAPVAPEPWSDPFDASAYGAQCSHMGPEGVPASEDCLNLNVWSGDLAGKQPVMVWIHGGGFRGGSNRLPEHYARHMAQDGVVLVSVQYRLGVMGFFAHPALDENHANFGLLDMIFALRWVQENIAKFGGDPDRVTIYGVSAGGMAVQMLMTSPLSKGLFAGAIAQSGYGTWPLADMATAREQGAELGTHAGLDRHADLDALKGVSASTWAQSYATFRLPIVDGTSLPHEPALAFLRGEQHRVPMILGGTSFEGTTIRGAGFDPDSYIDSYIEEQGEHAARVRQLYADDLRRDEQTAATRFFGDVRYVVGSRLIARLHAKVSRSHLYYFDHIPENMRDAWVGAPHGFATSVMFGESGRVTNSQVAAETRAHKRALRGYWRSFAINTDPNVDGQPHWPAYDADQDNWLVFRDSAVVETAVIKDKLDLIEEHYMRRIHSDE